LNVTIWTVVVDLGGPSSRHGFGVFRYESMIVLAVTSDE
jgi:hypothetical protein